MAGLILAGLSTLPAAASAATAATAATAWQAPLRPTTVTRAFAPPPTPYAAGHRGVDLSGEPGEAVLAAGDGHISFAGRIAGRGVVVVVHGALRTTYEPVEGDVRSGVHVVAGQRIGSLQGGHPGCPASACLHWGLLQGERYLDPMSLLTRSVIRLYPPAAILGSVASSGASGTAGREGMSAAAFQTAQTPTASTTPTTRPGPSPTTWSLVAMAGAGLLVTYRRRP